MHEDIPCQSNRLRTGDFPNEGRVSDIVATSTRTQLSPRSLYKLEIPGPDGRMDRVRSEDFYDMPKLQ